MCFCVSCLSCFHVCSLLPCGTWRERAAYLLAIVCDFYCDFVTVPFGIFGQVWNLIVSIPDPCCFLLRMNGQIGNKEGQLVIVL